ncbi:MAG: hypothetical protein FWF84_00135 [Kiritimatiellaeota bacterium]|nr:hypothetical protein [Kiritimatiellota bacterium]
MTAKIEHRDPDTLLIGTRKSMMTQGLLIALAVHAVVLFGTSFGLYKEWGEYGVYSSEHGIHSPSTIKEIKRQREKAAEEETRKAAQNARKEEQSAMAAKNASDKPAAKPAPKDDDDPLGIPRKDNYENQISPQKPFDISSDLGLD